MERETGRKIKQGTVISTKMKKTVVVSVEMKKRHPLYGKAVRKLKKFKAHDEKSECKQGDSVEIAETRPISKEKCWRVVKILGKEGS